jgi:hypothetical protein
MKRRASFQASTDGFLDAVVDAVEQLDGRRPRRTPDAASASPPEQGDFLQDLIHLNLQYLNQMARLSSSYSVVASRALERVYDYFGSADDECKGRTAGGESKEPTRPIVELTGARGESRRLVVLVKNSEAKPVTVRLKLQPADDYPAPIAGSLGWVDDDAFDAGYAPAPGLASERIELLPKETRQLTVFVRFSSALRLGRRHRVRVRLEAEPSTNGRNGREEPALTLSVSEFVISRVKA